MRSTLNAKSAALAEEPKGTLFLLKRYGHQPIYGIKLSEPLDQPNDKPGGSFDLHCFALLRTASHRFALVALLCTALNLS